MRVFTQFRTRCAAGLPSRYRTAAARSRQPNRARLTPEITATVATPSPITAPTLTAADPLTITALLRDRYGIRERPTELRGKSRRRAALTSLLVRLAIVGTLATYLLVIAAVAEHSTKHSSAQSHAIAEQSSPQTTIQPDQAGQLHMGMVSTGVAEVDNALRGFLTGDVEGAFSQLISQQVSCGTLPAGGMPFLPCSATEPRGTVHEMILATCEPRWATADEAKAELEAVLTETPGLYVIERQHSTYTAVLSWPNARDRSLVLTISAAGVTSYGTACGIPSDPNPDRELTFVTAHSG